MTEEPTPPPTLDDDAPPVLYPREGAKPAKPRNPIGWVVSGVLLLLSVVAAVSGYAGQDQAEQSYAQLQQELRSSVSMLASPMNGLSPKLRTDAKESLEDVLNESSASAADSEEAARIAVVAANELKREPPPTALKTLRKGDDKSSRAIAGVFDGDPTASDESALAAVKSEEYAVRLAKVQADEMAGRPSARKEVVDAGFLSKMIGFGLIAVLMVVTGVICLITFLASRSNLRAVGIQGVDKSDGDRYMFRFAAYMIGFALIGLGADLLADKPPFDRLGSVWSTTIAMALTLLFVVALMRVPILGQADSAAAVVAERRPFWKLVATGLYGYLCTIPVLLVAVAFIVLMSRFLPDPSHPITEEIARSSGAEWLGLFLVAAFFAPVIEELAFRGLLFPAIASQVKKPWVAMVLCGLVFAAIHPQGPLVWPALATTGTAAAALRYYTGSLVPCIALHMVHNGVLMASSFFIG